MRKIYFAFVLICMLFLTVTGCEFPFPKETKSNLPVGIDAHTVKLGAAYHKPGYDDPFSAEAGCSNSACHQSSLKGGAGFVDGKDVAVPSCYQCHGENWLEK